MLSEAKWISASDMGSDICPVFVRQFNLDKKVEKATMSITARGVYEAKINGKRVGDFVLAPGWTSYETRLQVQTYDITDLLDTENSVEITLGRGWFRSPIPGWINSEQKQARINQAGAIIASVDITYSDGTKTTIVTDDKFTCGESRILFSEIYDGERYDASKEIIANSKVSVLDISKDNLIPQEGEKVVEAERVLPCRIFKTPLGEVLVDFGQEVTGYVEISLDAKKGDVVRLLHGEVLTSEGNFYNENYRGAKAEIKYICKSGKQTWHPIHTFFGFRYVKLEEYPVEPDLSQFAAVVVHSDIKQTGFVQCGVEKLNKLFSNVFWGQMGNYLDIPTDCPQRDERLGWTGDAQVFVKAASYNYDVEKFFKKWLHDLRADQNSDGSVGVVIPDVLGEKPSAAWADAACICPWQVYQTYGDKTVLEDQFESMKGWVDYISNHTTKKNLWMGYEFGYGDWLGLDAPSGSYKGSTREEFIQSAFYYYSVSILVDAGKVLGRNVSGYETLKDNIRKAFNDEFPGYTTQTECVLATYFGLADSPKMVSDALAKRIKDAGNSMQTGFVGTPYILHALSDYGNTSVAYDLLLREDYPSWLYSVNKGATTIWEHWDGIMEDGSFWSSDMNSFNHYSYGSVIDWIYEKAAGIQPLTPGFEKAIISPNPDKRMGWLNVAIDTRHGRINSKWNYEGEKVRYEIVTPVDSVIVIRNNRHEVSPGKYIFWS